MAIPAGENPSKELVARIDELVRQTESLPDAFARDLAIELVQAVMGLHAMTLERMLEIVSASGGEQRIGALAGDGLVSSVLALHGLHPDGVETRVRRAIDKLRAVLEPRGVGIDLLEAEATLVRVRLTGLKHIAAAAAKQVIEDAIYEAAPEIGTLMIEGADEQHEAGFVPLSVLAGAHEV